MNATQDAPDKSLPRRQLSLFDSTSIIVGIIIGSAIFRASPDIAAGAGRWGQQWAALALGREAVDPSRTAVWEVAAVVGVWILGGLIALAGAMCYAELATAFPRAGGTYVFLTETFGRSVGFAFAWGEFWIVRPGNVGAISFVMASYALEALGYESANRPALELTFATAAILAISLLNAVGLRTGAWTQNVLTLAKVLGLALIVFVALTLPQAHNAQPLPTEPWKTLSLSLILVMFAYGGWADMSFVAAEVRNPERNISRALALGTLAVTAIYMATTLAFVWALGLRGLARSSAVAADVVSLRLGEAGSTLISLVVVVSCLGAIHGTLFTGARVYYALGTEHPTFRWLGVWDGSRGVPLRSLAAQTATTVGLVLAFGLRSGSFDRLVAFTAPFYWGFIGLVGIALIMARQRGQTGAGYRVPGYPLTPLLFALSSAAMVYAAIDYAFKNPAWEMLWGVAVIVTGLGAWLADRYSQRNARSN